VPYAEFRALSSPLSRCRDTAALLGLVVTLDRRLVEMDWGEFQGRTLTELRAERGIDLITNETRGLDFRPPGGESPRDVQARMAPLLAEIAAAGTPTLAVTHRGVIRAIYAQAVGWDMTGKPPHGLELYALHVFTLEPDGRPQLADVNIALDCR
jgi:probable phosphoglycerate mutase